jgi:hypothetical protein
MDRQEILDREYLDIRARLLAVAAQLDRIDRADGAERDDPRLAAIRRAVEILLSSQAGRAEAVQLTFSLPYDAAWKQKFNLAAAGNHSSGRGA